MTAKRPSEQGTPATKRQNRNEKEATRLTLQVFVSFPDSGYPDVVFEAAAESLVVDAAKAAADEWGADVEFLELAFADLALPSDSVLMSHGVEAGSQLTASLLQVFGHEWFFEDSGKREKLIRHLLNNDENHLSLDTSSFATEGRFWFDMAWIPDGIEEISFVNPHPSITSASFREPENEEFAVSKIDLKGLKSITTVDDCFLGSCTLLPVLSLACLENVTAIGSYFLSECLLISSLDLSGFNNVTTIDDGFLAGCTSLSSLDLTSLRSVTTIGEYFLSECSSLSSLDLTSLNNVTKFGSWFLNDCSSLSSLNLAGLRPESEVRKKLQDIGIASI